MAKILIADDRAVDRELLIALLGYMGHTLLEASDGIEALNVAVTERPDLIITDLLMPAMDGFELVRHLRTDPTVQNTPVIFYTATYLQYEARSLANSCGVQHILLKPSDPEVILSTVSDALGMAVPPPAAPMPEEFHRQHLKLVTDKLSQKLEVVIPRLVALIEIGQSLAREFDDRHMLPKFCQEARDILGAKYAALGLLNSDRKTLHTFITSGYSPENAARIGTPSVESGLLGQLSIETAPFRVADIASDPRATGFPPNHPPVKSFLGVPILFSANHYGWLYFADKLGADEFSDDDEQIAGTLAAQIAIAYENALRREELLRLNAELEQRVAQRTADLHELNKELEAFSYSVSHDLRAPVRAIRGYTGILLSDYLPDLPPHIEEYVRKISSYAQRMSELIDGLLILSRLNRQEIIRQTVNPADLVRQALEDLQAEQENRQVEVSIGDLPLCRADPRLLSQVFANLLSNALKFSRHQAVARIEVGSQCVDDEQIYWVKDNGCGFDMRYVGKLFNAFQRLHSQEEYEGTGIGLAIVQRIIQRHGGQIWVEAAVNRGAQFYFTLEECEDHE